jgi:transketolase
MRTTFAKTLLQIGLKDPKVMLLTGDLGYSVFEDFQTQIPKQFLNMGIAEQNMAGVAAGLAMEGLTPVIYSIVPFTTMRNFEQIRNDICYQNLNVKIVGVGAGFSYGPYGHTHHGLEDIGILRTLPNLVILAPGDPVEAMLATKAMMKHKGPVYLRLGKAGEPVLHTKSPVFAIGKGIVMKEGRDVTIIATSTMLETAMSVPNARIISMPTIKPLDEKIIIDSAKKTKVIVTLEEHSIVGGLGSAVAEVIAEHSLPVKFKRIGVPDRFTKVIGRQAYMRKANGLDVASIIKILTTIMKPL